MPANSSTSSPFAIGLRGILWLILACLTLLSLPLATLSNGSKTLVFQGMVHIGSESFYK
jgi:hypothetical protein